MKIFALLATALVLAAAPAVWLDASKPAGWNVAGAPIPAAAGPRDADLVAGGRCSATVRPPSLPEDRAVDSKGWFLVGPYQRYGKTSVLVATSSADGMCRPNGFQAFVFVSGAFAGTLSPQLMNSRSDAAFSGLGVSLSSAQDIAASFARYSAADPLCCPHATTSVSYKVVSRGLRSVVVPVSASTSKN